MQIEIAEPGRMSQSGSSLLKLIQNNQMPALDLLVRESIQNSLDAYDPKDDSKFVEVHMDSGEFSSRDLNNQLESITDIMNQRYPKPNYQYLAIRDYHTVGLTGKMSYDDVEKNDYGNLLKLVYEISKPQENAGAGGSWGLGKTVYFRIGIGLVIYYSRINNGHGRYESRLAATLVEDETSKNAMIPRYQGKIKRGIAWWGKKVAENDTRPITDEREINKILKIFNIEPYKEHETGTTVVIPYIDAEQLLANNKVHYENQNGSQYWLNSIESYLKIAVQRWYCPRINNSMYPYGKNLHVKINGDILKVSDMESIFQLYRSLYIYGSREMNTEFVEEKKLKIYCDDIKLKSVTKEASVGKIVYTKVMQKDLAMLYPDNKPTPFMYLNLPLISQEQNKPLICFTRQPGMIVSYNEMGAWVDGIKPTDINEFIIGIFVLNSRNQLALKNEENISLEEYVRKSEMADHISWNDFSIGSTNPGIVGKIQKHVRTKISKQFEKEENESTEITNSGFGKLFGDALLPPENFGKKPSARPGKKPGGKRVEVHKNGKFTINNVAIKYTKDGMQVPMTIHLKKGPSNISIEMGISSTSATVSVLEWENSLKKSSCSIEEVKLVINEKDKVSMNEKLVVTEKNKVQQNSDFKLELVCSPKKTGYKFCIDYNAKQSLEVSIYANVKISGKDIEPIFEYKEKSGD